MSGGSLMVFKLPEFIPPDFNQTFFVNAPNCKLQKVNKEGVAPSNFHSLSIYPEYFKIDGKWILVKESRMDTVVIVTPNNDIQAVEFRNLKIGDEVVIGRTEDGSEGIYIHHNGFKTDRDTIETFAFRSGRSRETAFSRDYDELYEIMEYEKDNDGKIVWVLGPSIALDEKSREAFVSLIENGYVNALLTSNTLATYDLERAMHKTVLGQKIFESRDNAHYNYIATINEAKRVGSLDMLVKSGKVDDGIIKACIEKDVPIVLAGGIRDRYALPGVYDDMYEAQDAMRKHTRKATMLISLSSVLHTIAAGNMTPSYTIKNGFVRPVYIYSIDIQEFSVNKLSDRGTLEVKTLVTNIQDFVVIVANKLIYR